MKYIIQEPMDTKRMFFIVAATLLTIILVVAAVLYFSSTNDQSSNTDKYWPDSASTSSGTTGNGASEPTSPDGQATKRYVKYSQTALTDEVNVLFFYAPWCPYCRTADANIKDELDQIPDNVTIFRTDYDNEVKLKRKYGVTYQHTFVQVDKEGNKIKKWSSSYTVQEILDQIVD